MTIEQEFFEAYKIRKIRQCELRDECFMGFSHSCKECDIYGQAYEVYPPITPEIVLGLEEIIFSYGFKLYIDDNKTYVYYLKNQYEVNYYDKNRITALLKVLIDIEWDINHNLVRELFNEQ